MGRSWPTQRPRQVSRFRRLAAPPAPLKPRVAAIDYEAVTRVVAAGIAHEIHRDATEVIAPATVDPTLHTRPHRG